MLPRSLQKIMLMAGVVRNHLVALWNTYFSWIFIYSLMIKKMQSFLCYMYSKERNFILRTSKFILAMSMLHQMISRVSVNLCSSVAVRALKTRTCSRSLESAKSKISLALLLLHTTVHLRTPGCGALCFLTHGAPQGLGWQVTIWRRHREAEGWTSAPYLAEFFN